MNSSRFKALGPLMHVLTEVFFAILPLIVLGAYWPDEAVAHPAGFFYSPEWSMTSCILYGLSLVRFQSGIFVRKTAGAHGHGATASVISILPLLGVIVSVILISKASHSTENIFIFYGQFINLFGSIISFVVLGGYGISRSE